MEAWIVLVMWMVMVVGGAAAGIVTAGAAAHAMDHERATRHAVAAVLRADAPPAAVKGAGERRVLREVLWSSRSGAPHTASVPVAAGLRAGSRVTVWLDEHGAPTAEPPGPGAAALEAAVYGLTAATTVVSAAFLAASLARRRLEARCLDLWDSEWERVEPRWRSGTR